MSKESITSRKGETRRDNTKQEVADKQLENNLLEDMRGGSIGLEEMKIDEK